MTDETTDEDGVRAVLSGATQGPPLGFDAQSLIEHGGKIRRRRKQLAVVGSSAATVLAVVAVTAVALGISRPSESPVVPAGPGLTTAPLVPTSTPAPTLPTPDVTSTARPEHPTSAVSAAPPSRQTTPRTTPRTAPPQAPPPVSQTSSIPGAPTTTQRP